MDNGNSHRAGRECLHAPFDGDSESERVAFLEVLRIVCCQTDAVVEGSVEGTNVLDANFLFDQVSARLPP